LRTGFFVQVSDHVFLVLSYHGYRFNADKLGIECARVFNQQIQCFCLKAVFLRYTYGAAAYVYPAPFALVVPSLIVFGLKSCRRLCIAGYVYIAHAITFGRYQFAYYVAGKSKVKALLFHMLSKFGM